MRVRHLIAINTYYLLVTLTFAGNVLGVVYAYRSESSVGFYLTLLSAISGIFFAFLFWNFVGFYYFGMRRFSGTDTLLPWRFAQQLYDTVKHYERRQDLLSSYEKPLRTKYKKELAKALQHIADKLYRVIKAQTVEISLWDRIHNRYHASYVVGKPFPHAINEEYDEVQFEENGIKIYHEDILFAGEQFGTVRVSFPANYGVTPEIKELILLYAQYCAVSVLNADFTNELLRMKRLADESVKVKTGFLANLSHEIRGPLGTIINAADILFEKLCGDLTEKQHRSIEIIRRQSAHLLDLVNDVLDYAKAESGKITPQRVSISAKEIITEMGSVIRQQASVKKQQVIIEAADPTLRLSCDKRHIRQIMINLLTNGVKYTPIDGKIFLSAEKIDGHKIKIMVRDTGIGIPVEQREKVFGVFERVEDEYASRQVGTGLGMPLTKKLCELNGGTIDFSSVPGEGSTFWVVFDAAVEPVEAKVTSEQKEITLDGQGRSLLLVAPDDTERMIFEDYLTNIHFEVSSADELGSTEKLITEKSFDLILIDDVVSAAFGCDPVRFLRGQNCKSPIFLLSSKAFAFDIEEQLRRGVDRCITKPVPLNELGEICCTSVSSHG